MQIAQANNVSQGTQPSATSALLWISRRANWLIVYDSADEHYSVVEKFLPPGNGGNVLITTRNPGLKRLTLVSLEVLDMTNEEGISLLLKSAMFDGTSDHIMVIARKVVAELGGIPIALDQAGGYMLSCGCSMDDYLELYTKHRDKLMSYPEFKGATGYDRNTYGTWEIAMQKIEKIAAEDTGEQSLAAHNAIKLFRMFAFLDHADIPQELFKNAAENYMESNIDKETMTPGLPLIVKLLNHETLFLNEEGGWNIIEFLSGIQVLLSFSLIKSHNQQYSMHLLVHAWSRSRLPKTEIADLYHRTRAVLSCSIVLDYNIDNYTFCRLLVRHIRSNSLHAMELKLQGTFYDDEYERFSLVFDHVGDWDEREKLLVVQVNQRKAKLGSDHKQTLFSMGHLASTYRSQGRWEEAEKLQIELMNATQAKLGSDHPHTLASIGNLALTYQVQGRWDEAEKLQTEVMNARQVKLGSDHPHTLNIRGNLAWTYQSQGRWDEAEKLQTEVMNARKAKLGSDHTHTLAAMSNLALTYRNQGRLDEAEKLQVQVLNVRQAKFGSDHPETLIAMNNLALTYQKQRRWGEAEKLQIQVMNARQANFGSDHPLTLTSMANLALTYWDQGRLDEAHSLLSHAIKMMQQVMGPQHPTTLKNEKSLDNLSKALLVCHDMILQHLCNPYFAWPKPKPRKGLREMWRKLIHLVILYCIGLFLSDYVVHLTYYMH